MAGAFSFVELQITLVILAIGLLGFAGLFRIYSQQIDYVQKYSEPNMYVSDSNNTAREYWIVSQTNEWMRQFAVPADIANSETPCWEPPSTGRPKIYTVHLDSFDLDQCQAVVSQDVNE